MCFYVCGGVFMCTPRSMNNDLTRVRFHWRRSPVSDTSGITSLPLMSNFQ